MPDLGADPTGLHPPPGEVPPTYSCVPLWGGFRSRGVFLGVPCQPVRLISLDVKGGVPQPTARRGRARQAPIHHERGPAGRRGTRPAVP
jgi:hypothetical protein